MQEVWDQVWASERVYIDCLERGAASLALASNDPVETIVDAAKGRRAGKIHYEEPACPSVRLDGRSGAGHALTSRPPEAAP